MEDIQDRLDYIRDREEQQYVDDLDRAFGLKAECPECEHVGMTFIVSGERGEESAYRCPTCGAVDQF